MPRKRWLSPLSALSLSLWESVHPTELLFLKDVIGKSLITACSPPACNEWWASAFGINQQSLKSELFEVMAWAAILFFALPYFREASCQRDLFHICILTGRGCWCTFVSCHGQKPQQSAGMGLIEHSLSQSTGTFNDLALGGSQIIGLQLAFGLKKKKPVLCGIPILSLGGHFQIPLSFKLLISIQWGWRGIV